MKMAEVIHLLVEDTDDQSAAIILDCIKNHMSPYVICP